MDLLDGIEPPQRRYWVGVACAAHVARGRAGAFMQLGHGKNAPLRRLKAGDGIVYYSPTREMGVADGYQSFTAIGFVRDDRIYVGDMGGGFTPSRRDVDWLDSRDAEIHPQRDSLSFTSGRSNWGYALRRGLVPVTAEDFALIRHAMSA